MIIFDKIFRGEYLLTYISKLNNDGVFEQELRGFFRRLLARNSRRLFTAESPCLEANIPRLDQHCCTRFFLVFFQTRRFRRFANVRHRQVAMRAMIASYRVSN